MESGSNCRVPADDLTVLKGCVTRNRALFSPTPSVERAFVQGRTVRTVGTWPDLVTSSQECCSVARDLSPDIMSPSEPNLYSCIPVSVSVQFAEIGERPKTESSSASTFSLQSKEQFQRDESCVLKQGAEFHLGSCSSSTPSGLNCGSRKTLNTTNCCASLSNLRVTEVTSESHHSTKADILSDVASSFGSDRSLFSSTCTFQEISSKSQYVKGVDGQVFKARMETIQKWFSESNDQQRNMILLNLLDQCNCVQMHLLSIHMEPLLHDRCPVNCHDLLSWLPSNIAFYILSFLDPVSLCRASQVCRIWHHMANDSRLWMRFCRLHTWQLSQSGEKKQRMKYVSADGRMMWKAMFSERFRIRRNWLKGFCNVRTFEGHTQGISCIQFDDTRIVSGSWDKTIKVWNRRTNTAWAALTLTGHSGTVRCLHLHDNRLVSGSSDRTIKVWDLSTDNVNWVGATCKITMVGHMHTVRCLQADHQKVISGSYDSTLKVWDLATGTCSLTLRGHSDAVLCLHFHGKILVSGSKDTTIKVWDLPGGCCQLTLHGHQAPVTCVQFDDTRVISGAVDRLIKIWSLETGQCLRTIDWICSEGHTGVIRYLQADSWKIVSAADDKTLKVWSLNTGNRLLTLKSHTDGVTCLQFNDEVIVSGSYDKTVKLWDFSVC